MFSLGCILSQIIQEAICGTQQLQKEEAVFFCGGGEGSGDVKQYEWS